MITVDDQDQELQLAEVQSGNRGSIMWHMANKID